MNYEYNKHPSSHEKNPPFLRKVQLGILRKPVESLWVTLADPHAAVSQYAERQTDGWMVRHHSMHSLPLYQLTMSLHTYCTTYYFYLCRRPCYSPLLLLRAQSLQVCHCQLRYMRAARPTAHPLAPNVVAPVIYYAVSSFPWQPGEWILLQRIDVDSLNTYTTPDRACAKGDQGILLEARQSTFKLV